jgi:hypothetical protein
MNSEVLDFIKRVLKFYDNNRIKYKKFYKSIKKHNLINSTNDNTKSKIQFINKDEQIFEESNYEVLGYYVNKNNNWIWSWYICGLEKNETELARNILNYGINIDCSEDNFFLNFIRNYLITGIIEINDIQLDLILAISLYITKKGTIYKTKIFTDDKNFYEQYFIVFPN